MIGFFMRWYRARLAIFLGAAWLVAVSFAAGRVWDGRIFDQVSAFLGFAVGTTVILTGLVSAFMAGRMPSHPTRVVHAPVIGRWRALNSPASKVPSHGVRGYGQAYAIDLVAEPEHAERPSFGGKTMRAAEEHPAMGMPVYSMVSGEVVAASDWRRDHRARSNTFGLLYLMAEGAVRELGGPGFIVGNHLIVRSDEGLFAAIAHLQRGSITVSVGERVEAGQQIARCGNSGNSSEPHVHAQLMDRRCLLRAQGLPMAFADIEVDGEGDGGLPGNNAHMIARGNAAQKALNLG